MDAYDLPPRSLDGAVYDGQRFSLLFNFVDLPTCLSVLFIYIVLHDIISVVISPLPVHAHCPLLHCCIIIGVLCLSACHSMLLLSQYVVQLSFVLSQ